MKRFLFDFENIFNSEWNELYADNKKKLYADNINSLYYYYCKCNHWCAHGNVKESIVELIKFISGAKLVAILISHIGRIPILIDGLTHWKFIGLSSVSWKSNIK
jgi:hypothetical protein